MSSFCCKLHFNISNSTPNVTTLCYRLKQIYEIPTLVKVVVTVGLEMHFFFGLNMFKFLHF